MNIIKKLRFWILITGMFYAPHSYTKLEKDNIVWENYASTATLGIINIICIYMLCSPPQEAVAMAHSEYPDIHESIAIVKKNTKVYYPTITSDDENLLQKLANITKYPNISIYEGYIRDSPEAIISFLNEAKKIAPCIAHIEEIEAKHEHYHKLQSTINLSLFIKEIELLEKNNESVIIVGTAKNSCIESINDITSISFNIENQNPSYKERLEFLQILLNNKNYISLDIEQIARKTIALSYLHIAELIQSAEKQVTQSKQISMSHIDNAYETIITTYKIDIEVFKNRYKACIHEIGHAVITAHFKKHFTLHNASITPQYELKKSPLEQTVFTRLGCTQFTKQYYKNQKIESNIQSIMISLAGKVSEQVFFGLPHKKSLNNKTGYDDLLKNPDGAQDDLIQVNIFIESIIEATKQNKNSLLKDLYAQTLKLVLSYKDKIEICAKLLEENEFVTGSQIRKALE